MNTARFQHAATVLGSGDVLVVGGENDGELATAELYNRGAGRWTSVKEMASARAGHTATLLRSGKVLVAGGVGQAGGVTAEVYDPEAKTWTSTGPMVASRHFHTATLLNSDKVLVTGGVDSGDGRTAELYDPQTNTWAPTNSMAYPRTKHTATLLPSGKVLVAGGCDRALLDSGECPGTVVAKAELYDPQTGTWAAAGSMGWPSLEHTATRLPSGKVLVTGGAGQDGPLRRAEFYDPSGNVWATTGDMVSARDAHTATLMPSGQVLVAGGVDGDKGVKTTEFYDPRDGVWIAAGAMASSRIDHVALGLESGEVLVTGGLVIGDSGSPTVLSTAELYVPAGVTPPATPKVTAPSEGTILRTSRPDFTGTADAGSTVKVSVDGVVMGTAAADATGVWHFMPVIPLAHGPHAVIAAIAGSDGQPGPSSEPVHFLIWRSRYTWSCSAGPGPRSAAPVGLALVVSLWAARRRAKPALAPVPSRLARRAGARRAIPCALGVLLAGEASAATAAPKTQNPLLPDVARLYDDLEPDAALARVKDASRWPGNGPAEQAWLALMEGVLRFGMGDPARARGAFERALAIEPDSELPVEASPALRRFFAQLREDARPPVPAPEPIPAPPPPAPAPPVRFSPMRAESAPPPRAAELPVGSADSARADGVGLGLRGEADLLGGSLTPAVSAELVHGNFGGAATLVVNPSPGFRLEGRYFLGERAWRPYLSLGTTAFLPAVGARAAAGVDVRLGSFHVFADAAYERWFDRRSLFAPDVVLLSAGVGWRFSIWPSR